MSMMKLIENTTTISFQGIPAQRAAESLFLFHCDLIEDEDTAESALHRKRKEEAALISMSDRDS